MAILFRMSGGRELGTFLGGVAARMRSPGAAFKFIGEEMLVRTHKRMRAGVDVHGQPFKQSRRAASGASPNTMPVTTATAKLNSSTRVSMVMRSGRAKYGPPSERATRT